MANRFYVHPESGEQFPSVTSVISELAKPALYGWYARMAAEGEDPYRIAAQAARRGSLVHKLIAAFCAGHRVMTPPELTGYLSAWGAWVDDNVSEFLLSEQTVFNEGDGYAGTLDAVVWLKDGSVCLVDYKTSERAYPEVALQLCAYSRAVDLPVDSARVVVLRNDGTYEQSKADISDQTYGAFLGLLIAHTWVYRHSAQVLSPVPGLSPVRD
jgi:hypothetical protein